MAREVRHEETEPAVFDADDLGDDGLLYVCQCGLSSKRPLCDGTHNETVDEEEGVVYKYEDDATDRRVIEEFEFVDE